MCVCVCVSPISSDDTGVQPSTPLVNRLVDDMLLQSGPCSNQLPPLHISNVEYRRAIDLLPHHDPDLAVHWTRVEAVRGHRFETVNYSAA